MEVITKRKSPDRAHPQDLEAHQQNLNQLKLLLVKAVVEAGLSIIVVVKVEVVSV